MRDSQLGDERVHGINNYIAKAKHRPMIVITRNNEKELRDAFLRRCFFHHIQFPDRATM